MLLCLKSLIKPILCSIIISQLFSCTSQKENKILVFYKNKKNQEAVGEAVNLLALYVVKNGIEVDTTTNATYFNEDSLKKYATVVFLNTSQDVLDTRQQNEFERFVQAGGGFVGIHADKCTKYQWPWYNDMIGAEIVEQSEQQPNPSIIYLRTTDVEKPFSGEIPKSWNESDDLYKIDSYSPDIKVLIETKEKMPVSWYREYDGGYLFYTSAGGTIESFKSEPFLKHIFAGIKYTMDKAALDYTKVHTERVPEDNRFLPIVLDTYLNEPIEMEVMKDGRVLFIERNGKVKLYNPAEKQTKVLADLDVHTTGNYEDGLLGLALDPLFEVNNYIYLYYSPVGEKAVQNLSRFTLLGGDSLIMTSEKIVLEVPVQRKTCCHSAGNIYFGPDGYFYLATGDNTSSKESDGFSPIDERPGRGPFDAQKSSGNTHDLRGKILRIDIEADGSYTIPEGNLFPKDGSEGRPEIYIMGVRNPYRMTVDKRGYVYWGDVGPDGGTANERGPKSQDEWNQARGPGNYGWPYFVGDNKAYADFDFETNEIGSKFDPDKPVNESPYNYGAKVLPPAQEAMIWYPYDASKEFPMLGTGSRSAMSGPFFYVNDYSKSRHRFPEYYDKKLFIFEWARSWIKVLTFNEEGDLRKIEPFLPDYDFAHPIDIKFGPDGAMYVLTYGANYFAQNPDAQLIKIDYAKDNREPVAKIDADKTVGAAPFKIQLSGKESFDYDKNDQLRYEWSSGTGEEATGVTTTFTYTEPGVYKPKLTVIDKSGDKAIAEIEIKVGNEIPQVDIMIKGNKTFYFDSAEVVYSVKVMDKEDGQLNNGIEEDQVHFTVDYLPEGKDLALLTSNSQKAERVSARYIKGRILIDNSGCKSCHAMDKKSIGPSWLAVAERYRDSEAVPMLAKKVIEGGNGNWGKTMMAAHPQHNVQETTEMVKYILSLGEESTGKLPLEGSYPLTEHIGKGESGTYILTASYTDKGNEYTGQLTGRESIFLRHPKVQAEDFDASENVVQQIPHGEGVGVVTDIKHGSYIAFNNIDLEGISSILFNVASGRDGNIIEAHLNASEGKLIGAVKVNPNAQNPWQLKTYVLPLEEAKDMNNIYFVFKNDQVKDQNLMNIDWIYFKR